MMSLELPYTVALLYDEIDRLRSQNARLLMALKAMLECHGRPMREEWINTEAYEHAVQVYAETVEAIAAAQGGGGGRAG